MKYALVLSATCLLLTSAAFAQSPVPEGVKLDPKLSNQRAKEGLDRMFKTIDGDGDGVITKAESDAFSAKKFAEQDANNDGKVTKAEWDELLEKRRQAFNTNHPDAAPKQSVPAKK